MVTNYVERSIPGAVVSGNSPVLVGSTMLSSVNNSFLQNIQISCPLTVPGDNAVMQLRISGANTGHHYLISRPTYVGYSPISLGTTTYGAGITLSSASSQTCYLDAALNLPVKDDDVAIKVYGLRWDSAGGVTLGSTSIKLFYNKNYISGA